MTKATTRILMIRSLLLALALTGAVVAQTATIIRTGCEPQTSCSGWLDPNPSPPVVIRRASGNHPFEIGVLQPGSTVDVRWRGWTVMTAQPPRAFPYFDLGHLQYGGYSYALPLWLRPDLIVDTHWVESWANPHDPTGFVSMGPLPFGLQVLPPGLSIYWQSFGNHSPGRDLCGSLGLPTFRCIGFMTPVVQIDT